MVNSVGKTKRDPERVPAVTVLALSLAISVSCTDPTNTTTRRPTQMVTDDLGRQVELVERPPRLVSLAPSITEMLFALGVGDRIAGVTSYCDYPPEATSKPKVGDTIHPSLERILALKPHLVVASRASQLEAFARRLEALGIPLYVVDARGLDDVPRSLVRLGLVLNQGEHAKAVAQSLERRMREIEERVRGLPKMKVLLVVQREPLMVPGTRSFLADLIRRAGGVPIGPDDEREGVTFSLESVIAGHPDVIILPEAGADTQRLTGVEWATLATTGAIRRGNVYSMNADLIFRPGPRLIDGFSELARILHPEGFQRQESQGPGSQIRR